MAILKLTTLFASSVAALLIVSAPASAARCSESNPAALTLVDTAGLKNDRVQINEGKGADQSASFEYKVDGCTVAGGTRDAMVIGPSKERGVTAMIVSKGTANVTLIVDFEKNSLRSGDYQLRVSSDDSALPVRQRVNVDVKAVGWPPWAVSVAGALVGLVVLAMRFAASSSSTSYKAGFKQFFKPKNSGFPVTIGLIAVGVVFYKLYASNPSWFGGLGPNSLLLGSVVAAMVSGATVATAATGVGAKPK